MTNNPDTWVLRRTIRRPAPATLHSREVELRMTDDGRYVTLSRYVERYGEAGTASCVVRHHRVPVAQMIRWMVSHGVVEEETSELQSLRVG
jgi:hypothetical protein